MRHITRSRHCSRESGMPSTSKQIMMEKSGRGAIARRSVEYGRDVRGTSGGKWREYIGTGVAVGVLNSTNLLTFGAFGRRLLRREEQT